MRLEIPGEAVTRAMKVTDITNNASKLRVVSLRSVLENGAVVTFDRGSLRY